MNRQQKEQVVESLRESFTKSDAFLIGYRGLSVAQMQALRNDLRQHGGTMRVTKARLMKRAVEGLEGAQNMEPYFKDQIALVFSAQEPSAVAKALNTFAKENEALSIVAGCLDEQVVDAASVVRIASLPSREVLLAQLLGTLQAPTKNFASVLNMQVLRLLWTLNKVAEQKK